MIVTIISFMIIQGIIAIKMEDFGKFCVLIAVLLCYEWISIIRIMTYHSKLFLFDYYILIRFMFCRNFMLANVTRLQ